MAMLDANVKLLCDHVPHGEEELVVLLQNIKLDIRKNLQFCAWDFYLRDSDRKTPSPVHCKPVRVDWWMELSKLNSLPYALSSPSDINYLQGNRSSVATGVKLHSVE